MKEIELFKTLMHHAAVAGVSVSINIFPKDAETPEFAEVDEVPVNEEGAALDVKATDSGRNPNYRLFDHGERVLLVTSFEAYETEQNVKAQRVARATGEKFTGELVSFSGPIEEGHIIGVSTYSNGSPPSYLVRYRGGDGRQVEAWHSEDALVRHPG